MAAEWLHGKGAAIVDAELWLVRNAVPPSIVQSNLPIDENRLSSMIVCHSASELRFRQSVNLAFFITGYISLIKERLALHNEFSHSPVDVTR
jgi:hypothetical protein